MLRVPLTDDQSALLRALAEGETPTAIARRLDCPRSTLLLRLTRLYDRLLAVNAASAVHRAHEEGLL